MNEWLPIESAPEMRTVILWADTSTPDAQNWRMGSGFYHREMKIWIWEGEQVRGWAFPPTHWMALPSPPNTQPTNTLASSGTALEATPETPLCASNESSLTDSEKLSEILRIVRELRRMAPTV